MSTIKRNLIAVTAFAILTAQRTPMANEFALHPASGGVIRLHNDHGGLLRHINTDLYRRGRTENVSSLTECVKRPVPWLSASCRLAKYA